MAGSKEKQFKKESGYEDEDDEKIVDEEFNLTSSGGSNGGGKRDSDFLKELMKPPIRTKITVSTKSGGASAVTKQASNYSDEGSGDYADEIDEFIKKHVENEEKDRLKPSLSVLAQDHAKRFTSTTSSESSSDHDDDGDSDSDEGKNKKTPKEHLLECLAKLADTYSKYSLTDR